MSDILERGVIGHNSQNLVPVGEELAELLDLSHTPLIERRDQLVEAESRMPPVTDDETAAKASDYIDLLNALIAKAKEAHKEAKAPYFDSGKVVDEFFFRGITDPVGEVLKRAKQTVALYLVGKAAKERAAREEAERVAQAEATRLAREAAEAAQKLETEADLQQAIEAETAATEAQVIAVEATQAAGAKTSAMASVKGTVGRAKSLKTFWDFRNIDRQTIDLNALRPYLPVEGLEKAIRAYIAAGGRKIDGADIFENTRL